MIGRPRTRPDTPEIERKRAATRECMRRKAAQRAARQASTDDLLQVMIASGTGSPERKVLMLQILARQKAAGVMP